MAEVPPPPPGKKLREGFTTGACAAAAAKAAAWMLKNQCPVADVEIALPIGRRVAFPLRQARFEAALAFASVVKDAGDDPDCTHGAEICAEVAWGAPPGEVLLARGDGVGVVTREGIGVPVGEPAVNPVPRRMIRESVGEALGAELAARGVRVTISVPRGEEMAKETLNARLGIQGGISILGTTGIVKPFSTAAWRASVVQGIDVARANGCREAVCTTGGKSEKFAMAIRRDLPEVAFVQMGDFVGTAIRHAARAGIARVTVCGMMGKMSKIAAGVMQTHAAGSEVDMKFLASVAREAGAGEDLAGRIEGANTGRHVQEICQGAGFSAFFGRLAERIAAACGGHANGGIEVEAILTDFEGNVLGRAVRAATPGASPPAPPEDGE